jgi:hypothetical protein
MKHRTVAELSRELSQKSLQRYGWGLRPPQTVASQCSDPGTVAGNCSGTVAANTFPEGFEIIHDGQAYRPLGIRDHERDDGTSIKVIDWQTECPSCGVTFVVWTRMAFSTPNRRCTACKKPGLTVRQERKRAAP